MGADLTDIETKIEPRQALAALGYDDVSEPRRVKGGWDTLLWRFATPDGQQHSLRVHYLPDRDEFAWREQAALGACAKADLPAPRIETVGEFESLPAMVLSWCPGIPLWAFMEKRPWALWRLGRLFGQVQAQMHAAAPPEEFVAKAPDDWLVKVTDPYLDLVEHARTLQLATSSLIHMDYHPLNFVSDGATVTGILDWARSAAGDPRADLARTEITLLWAPIPPGPLSPILNLARRLFLRAWRSGYRSTAGHLPDFLPLRAWAGATLLAEIELVVDQPGVLGTREDLERLRRMIGAWARESGIR